jgi:tripartite-type tricarboxylate transporter receptor subunit TctC
MNVHFSISTGRWLAALFGAAVFCATGLASAQAEDAKPVRLVVGFPAGGAADTLARRVAEGMAASLKQPVVVDNKPGANTIIAVNALKAAPADGATMMLSTDSTIILNPVLYKSLPYDVARDLAPVGHIATTPLILTASPALAAGTPAELVKLAKARPGTLNYSSFGRGGTAHLAGELFRSMADIDVVHVAYAGGGPAQLAKVAGDVQYGFGILGSDMALVKDGRLRALAVGTVKRTRLAPQLPTLDELGFKGFDVTPKFGLVTRSGVPERTIVRVNAALNDVLRDPAFVSSMEKLGYEVGAPDTPAAYRQEMEADRVKWTQYIQRTGITID